MGINIWFKYKFNNNCLPPLLPCTESEYQFHITTKNGIDVTENVIKFMGCNFVCKLKTIIAIIQSLFFL